MMALPFWKTTRRAGGSCVPPSFAWPHKHWRAAALAKPGAARYPVRVTEKEVTGFGDLNTHSGQAAQCGFFTSVYPWHAFNGGLGGDTFGYAGGCVCRFANLIQFRHPHLAMRGGLTATHGGRNAK